MKNNKGQALVEFALILPVIIIIIIYIIDLSSILIQKYKLESDIDLIVTLYNEKKQDEINTYIQNNNVIIDYKTENNLTTIELKKSIKTSLPLVNRIMGNNINTKRIVYNGIETNE